MPHPRHDDGFRNLMTRIKSGSDGTAWDELLERVLPDLWRAAIQALGDGDPPAVGRLVGSTLVAIAAELDNFQPGEDEAAADVEFRDWWTSLMLAAAPALPHVLHPLAPKDRPESSRQATSSPPRFENADRPHGKRLVALVQGMSSPPSDAQREQLVHDMRPLLWRAAIAMLGDEQPRQVALLVEQTAAAVLAHLGDAPIMKDDRAFDRWWQGLMVQLVSLLPGQESRA